MIDGNKKDSVTIVLPCFNDGEYITKVVENFKNAGYKNILIIDDGSSMETAQIIDNLKVDVIRNHKTTSLNLAILEGIYNTQSNFALIVNRYNDLLEHGCIDQFLSFAISGHYSILIAEDTSGQSGALSAIIKERFGIFLQNPLFDVVFFDRKLLWLIKNEVSGTGAYIYFEVMKTAIQHKLKLGTYPIGLSRDTLTLPVKFRAFLFRKRHVNPKMYFKYAVPDIYKLEIKKQLMVAVIGFSCIRTIEFIIGYIFK